MDQPEGEILEKKILVHPIQKGILEFKLQLFLLTFDSPTWHRYLFPFFFSFFFFIPDAFDEINGKGGIDNFLKLAYTFDVLFQNIPSRPKWILIGQVFSFFLFSEVVSKINIFHQKILVGVSFC